MLQALGARFLNAENQSLGYGGEQLIHTAHIDLSQLDSRLAQVQIEVACDVNNPLCGETGASAVFGPQKGATAQMVQQLDAALAHFAEKVQQQLGINIANQSGAGAAGGMGGGLLLLPKVRLKKGVNIVLETLNFSTQVQDADLVITGEGRMDGQSAYGKTPIGVAKTAKQFDKPVIAIVGCLREDYEVVYEQGIDAVFPIIRQLDSLENTLRSGKENLISTAQNIARFYQLVIK